MKIVQFYDALRRERKRRLIINVRDIEIRASLQQKVNDVIGVLLKSHVQRGVSLLCINHP